MSGRSDDQNMFDWIVCSVHDFMSDHCGGRGDSPLEIRDVRIIGRNVILIMENGVCYRIRAEHAGYATGSMRKGNS